ncbi:MAG: VWA domain-containing protein [Bacilli bacterium]|nr:VWA domain-containing protein [Bacilli bacterium]
MNNTNAQVIVMNPWYALIAIPLVAITIIFFFRLPKMKRKWTKNLISLGLHFLIAATLTLTFVDIQYLYSSKETELVVLADVSDSQKDSMEDINNVITKLYSKKDNATKICVVAYAKECKVVTDFGGSYKDGIKAVFNEEKFDKTSTNIEKALKFANTKYSEESVKRLLVVSDGIETDGRASNVLDELLNNEVMIDCVYTKGDTSFNEIAITKVDYVDRVFLNRDQKVEVTVRTFKEAQIHVSIMQNDVVFDAADVQINRGNNKIEFALPTDVTGEFTYKVNISNKAGTPTLDDHYVENNTVTFNQDVTDKFKVLILKNEESKNMKQVFVDMGVFSASTDVTEYYYKSNALYEQLGHFALDRLLSFDEFVFYDVNVKDIPHYAEFIPNLFTCVATYGKTLQNFGDTNLREIDGNEMLETYASMLPLQLESSDEKAVVLNIDVSGSMSGNPLDQAKAGAIACLDILNDSDYIGIVNFSDTGTVIQPLTSLNNATQVEQNINSMQTIGGTQMNAGLEKCEELLANTTFEYKYVITLSDGEPFERDDEIITQVQKMADQNIVCSFINIDNPSGETLLTTLADAGYGEYYFCNNVNDLVDIMIAAVDIKTLSNQVSNKDCPVQVAIKEDPTVEGVNEEDLVPLRGYYVARRKNDATTVLTTQYQIVDHGQVVGTTTVPLFSYWKFGKGSVCAFTSNLGNWSSVFRSTQSAKKFFRNAWDVMLPERASHDLLQFTYDTHGATTDVHVFAGESVKPVDLIGKSNVVLEMSEPGKTEKVSFQLVYDGTQYSANIPTEMVGTYKCHIKYVEKKQLINLEVIDNPIGEGDFDLYFNYSSEYNVFDLSEGDLLYKIATNSENVKINDANYEALGAEIENRSYRSTNMWFLLGTLALFLADVFVRKGEPKRKKAEYTVGENRM